MIKVLTSPNTIYLPVIIISLIFASCDSSKVYENFVDFDESFWHQDSVVTFDFVIEDSDQPYNLLTHFRNSQAYPYHNMYYRYSLKDENDSILSEDLMQIFLFDPKTGYPNGSGIGDLFDQTQPILENYKFQKAGNYKAEIRQYMRLDTLPFILSVGWRVETVDSD